MNSPRYHLPPPLLQVAMAVGYLDPIPVERVRAARRQVLVVLTASWQVWGSVRKCGVCGAREGSPEAGDGGADGILAGVGTDVWGGCIRKRSVPHEDSRWCYSAFSR